MSSNKSSLLVYMSSLIWAKGNGKLILFLTLPFFLCVHVCLWTAVQSISHPLLLPYSFPKPLPFPQAHPIQRQFPLFSGPPSSGTNLSELSCQSPVNSALQFTQTLNWPVKSYTEWPFNRVMGLQERIKSGPQDKNHHNEENKKNISWDHALEVLLLSLLLVFIIIISFCFKFIHSHWMVESKALYISDTIPSSSPQVILIRNSFSFHF